MNPVGRPHYARSPHPRRTIMAGISSSIGLVSGIDSGSLIEQLVQLERRPIQTLETRIAKTAQVQLAYTQLGTRLNTLKSSATALRKPTTFDQNTVNVSGADTLTATAGVGTAAGSYDFSVARLVSAQQLISSGFADADTARVGAGTIDVELGDSRLDRAATLDELRDGEGIDRGVIELTDRAGGSARIDLGDAITLDDVVDRINAASGVRFSASVEDSQLVLTDRSGGTGRLIVRDVAGTAAADLGIVADASVNGVTGDNLAGFDRGTSLASLRDGKGIAAGAGDGLSVTTRNGTSFDVDFGGAETIGDLIDLFNDAAGGAATMNISGRGLAVTDNTSPPLLSTTSLTITGLGGSAAADQLGLAGSDTGGSLTGDGLLAGVDSYLLSSLNGGSGLALGQIAVTDSLGGSATIDLRNAIDVRDVLDRFNASGLNVRAQLNDAGNGIDLVELDGGSLTLSDASGTGAADLGIAGTFAEGVARGANLQRAWFGGDTKLEDLNIGRGVRSGVMSVRDSTGATAEFDFSGDGFETVADVLAELNKADSGVAITARINDTGDGLLIEDTGGGTLVIEDKSGAFATDLRLAGTHDAGVADGSYEVRVEIDATDTLEDVREKVNDLALPVRSDIISTGSGATPYRLSVLGREAGAMAGFTFDARLGDNGAAMTTDALSRARDAVVFLGGATSARPLMITSGSNSVQNVVPGLSLELTQVGGPTRVTVATDESGVVEEIEKMVESFNALRDGIDEATDFDAETKRRGLLLGEPTVTRIETDLYRVMNATVDSGNPQYRILADVGVTMTEGAKLEFDAEAFRAALADDAESVKRLFSSVDGGFGKRLQEMIESATDPADGRLKRVDDTLKEKTSDYEKQIATIEVRVEAKQQRLAKQFLDMELALSKLNFQQQQLASIPTLNYQPVERAG